MAIVIFLVLFIGIEFQALCLPAYANFDAGDATEMLVARFGIGKFTGCSVDNGQIVKIDFDKKVQPEERKEIEDFAKMIDMTQQGRRDIHLAIEAEKQSIASDPKLTDAQHAELKAKLERAAAMSDLQAKKAKLEEAQQAKADAKTKDVDVNLNLNLKPVKPKIVLKP